ncbi:hypothetical protein CAPTEDRAFT_126517 [Capitella teleta]|uniref:sphingosine kinase n=1 Tax=Capitella teleta TaxID=283909 RepID=R7U1R5_CAPTE|nr:hypothetical protein CAPTEDRAFT_126517 [Capitella teleta]|eukprot:ELT99919.1 hypothetical protein CAPTEDRAFT_126517 [Capitella teleta]
MKDVIGCDCMKGKMDSDPKSYLTVYAYPHKKKFASKKTTRKRQTVIIVFGKSQSRAENEEESKLWWKVIKCILSNVPISPGQGEIYLTQLTIPLTKRFLVLVNPFSGPGLALTLFQERVVPMLAEAGFPYHMIVTEHAGHGRQLMQSLELDQWAGVVIVSGDGLIYEVINGLMEREDWEKAIKMPIGTLPGGSGNALCVSMLFAAGYVALLPTGDNAMLHATFALIKHEVIPMDIVAVDTVSGKRLYSFLSVAWGLTSDVDIESERYRSMGGARFTVGAMARIINLRKYHGRVSFLPADDFVPGPMTRSRSLCESQISSQLAITTQPVHRSVSMTEEFQRPNRRQSDLGSLPESASELNLTDTDANLVKVDVGSNGGMNSNHNSSNNLPTFDAERDAKMVAPHVPTPLLPALSEPIPSNWITLDQTFIQVVAAYQTHLNADFIVTNECRFNDGVLHLTMSSGDCSRRQVLQQISDFIEEKIHTNPDVELLRVKAFRLEPISPPGNMCVDGELVEYGTIQAQVLPSMARIMTLTPKYQVTQL